MKAIIALLLLNTSANGIVLKHKINNKLIHQQRGIFSGMVEAIETDQQIDQAETDRVDRHK